MFQVSAGDTAGEISTTKQQDVFFLNHFLHVCGCVCPRHPDRFYQQRCAGLYLEWHLEA